MSVDLKAIRERARACLAVGVHTRDQLDRREALEALDRTTAIIRRAMAHCGGECEWCIEARDLLRDLDGAARGGGR